MKVRLLIERTVLVLSFFVLAGTNKCQEDYSFATQTRISITTTGTVTPDVTGTRTPLGTRTVTATPTEEGADIGPTARETGTAIAKLTATTVPTATNRARLLAEAEGVSSRSIAIGQGSEGLLSELATLDKPDQDPVIGTPGPGSPPAGSGAAASGQVDGNWLGAMYNDPKNSDASAGGQNVKKFSSQDSDQDGYADDLEDLERTDPRNPNSIPDWIKATDLSSRLRGNDDDGDGVTNIEERDQGTDPLKPDSDGDGVFDGAERLSGSNPLSAQSLPIDSDGDGLSDDFERSQGTNPNSPDSDKDKVSDSVEEALGTNPVVSDSDLDGVSDGREIQAGSDPLIPESTK